MSHMKKFGKNREVDPRYLNVPVKYITGNVVGSNEGGKDKYEVVPFEEWKNRMESWSKENGLPPHEYTLEGYKAWIKFCEENGYTHHKELTKEGKDKSLCIVDFYGNDKALVAWRNNNTCKMGMTRICKIVKKDDKSYINYRGKLILISDPWGWVF